MLNNLLASIILSTVIASCSLSIAQSNQSVYIFNDELRSEYREKDISFKKKRTPIVFSSNIIVNNCLGYLSEIKKSEIKDTANNLMLQNEYLPCETLDLIKNKNLSTKSMPLNYGNEIASRLDLSSFPSSLNRRARSNNKTLDDFGPQHLTIKPFSIHRETDDWDYTIEIIASTDLNNDSINDLILWVYDKAKFGSYHTYSTLIVLVYNNDKPLLGALYNEWEP